MSFLAVIVVASGAAAADGSLDSVSSVRSLSSALEDAGSGGAFCQEMLALKKAVSPSSPAALKVAVGKFRSGEAALLASTPSAINGDVRKVLAYANLVFDELAKVNYDGANMPPAVAEQLFKDGEAVTPADNAMDAYVKKACGIKLPPVVSTS